MKKLDQLLIQSFIPPFIITFFIALFVLIMQFIWVHIDDIMGKGVGLLVILEMIFYFSIALIPLALPIATILSSVMVMGNLAERYELSSIKSAGIPLTRTMRPLMLFTLGVTISSLLCSNYFIPLANLQYKTRLKDISRQKMALSLETGVFNDDFKNMSIHIGEKDPDGKHIKDVIIHDYSSKRNAPMKIIAERGEMFISNNNKYLVMNLFNGIQYQETGQIKSKNVSGHPFSRTSFREWNKIFDLSEFDLELKDREQYKEHYAVLSVPQLQNKIDTLDKKIADRISKLDMYYDQYFNLNSKTIISDKEDSSDVILEQEITKPLKEYKTITPTFKKIKDRTSLISNAKIFTKSIHSNAKNTHYQLTKELENRVKYIYELNIKFSLALICFVFLFIGAPLGAIIKKGGFGYPILIAVSFFLFYYVLNMLFKKLAESMSIAPEIAAWVPCAFLFLIGLLMTRRAVRN